MATHVIGIGSQGDEGPGPIKVARLKADHNRNDFSSYRYTLAVSRFNLDLKKFLKGLPKYYIQKTM